MNSRMYLEKIKNWDGGDFYYDGLDVDSWERRWSFGPINQAMILVLADKYLPPCCVPSWRSSTDCSSASVASGFDFSSLIGEETEDPLGIVWRLCMASSFMASLQKR